MDTKVEIAVWGKKIVQIVGLSQTVRPQVHDVQVPVILPSVKNKQEKEKEKIKGKMWPHLFQGST